MQIEERDIRIDKLKTIRDGGVVPYKDRYEKTHSLLGAKGLPLDTKGVRIAGRILTVRSFGRLIFATLKDFSGKMQIALQEKAVGKDNFSFFKKNMDIGDFIGAEGSIFKTKTGEITLNVSNYDLLSKTLRPLPEKWHGLTERELLYRQRYLDLVMNDGTLERFLKRTRIIKSIRNFLDSSGFVEVETPVLQTKPSGAIATPFVTHHNALDLDLYLRIAPETYLKRCMAGGFEKVYEFARSFRNEGLDPSHLQDFTLLEYYAAYWNYEDNMRFTEDLVKHVLVEVDGSLELVFGDKHINFDHEWRRVPMSTLIKEATGIDIGKFSSARELKKAIENRDIEIHGIETMGFGTLTDNLFKKVSRPTIEGPLFVIHHPIELSPLARRNDNNPAVTDRFQLVVNGWEIVNAYSELIDPIDQRERLKEQAELHSSGDSEAMVMDEDFLTAMEHGMPPISGWGMGVDRFVCLLTNQENLRDVILFPLIKPLIKPVSGPVEDSEQDKDDNLKTTQGAV
ncbi:MAG TPA: lysine--tRNA ligase [Spirochaetes bacterium]|nr:lysine--tRNA ligase [Spirochaetota bacterium]